MSDIRVSLRGGQTAFRPGEIIEGSASWNLPAGPGTIEIRLVWFTRGRGTPDISVVEVQPVASTSTMGEAPFRFRLPEGPHSFSGKLISLMWAVEAVALSKKGGKPMDSGRFEFVLSPDGQEIILPVAEKPISRAKASFLERKSALYGSAVERR